MAFLKTHTEIYKFFRGKEWFAYIFNMFQESCFSMCLIMTLLCGEITIEWQHKKKPPQNLASKRRIGGPASAVGICRLPESSLKQHTEKKSVLALISVSRAQEFWRMMLNEVNHYYTVGFVNSNPPAIARFFFHLNNSKWRTMIWGTIWACLWVGSGTSIAMEDRSLLLLL